MPRRLQIPAKLADLLSDPKRTRDFLAIVDAMFNASTELVPPAAANSLARGKYLFDGDAPSLVVRYPFRFTAKIPQASASTSSNTDAINGMLAQFTLSGINPP